MTGTSGEMLRAVQTNLPTRTGRSLEEWISVVETEGPASQPERVTWLKRRHGLNGTQARLVATRAGHPGPSLDDGGAVLVNAQYDGPRESLRPIYERIVAAARALGPDVRVEPCKAYVPLIRQRQFAMIKPSTRSRVDLGLALDKARPRGRLKPATNLSGSERIQLRIPLERPDEVDVEVLRWLRRAYEADARA